MTINHVILKNHFSGKDTTIVGDVINNGCQTFHIDEIDEVCNKFKVSDKQKQQAIDAHSTINSHDFTDLFNSNCCTIISCLLHQGVHSDQMIVCKLGELPNPVEKRKFDEVRVAVARYGYDLDTLVHDECADVRYQVAQHGYRLDKLINDPSIFVRVEVACQGYGLEKLMYDPTLGVQFEVVKQGYRLDHFINSDMITIRMEVARQGYGLDILSKDSCSFVRSEALAMIEKQAKEYTQK